MIYTTMFLLGYVMLWLSPVKGSGAVTMSIVRGEYCHSLCGLLWKRFEDRSICRMDNGSQLCAVTAVVHNRSNQLRDNTQYLLQNHNWLYEVQRNIPGWKVLQQTQLMVCMEFEARFGSECVRSSDCGFENGRCLNDRCECSIGYSYDYKRSQCVQKCTKYGDKFATYSNTGIGGCNVVYLRETTEADCMKTCLETTEFVCISAEHGASQCCLCDKTWFELKESQRLEKDPGWTLFYRHCL